MCEAMNNTFGRSESASKEHWALLAVHSHEERDLNTIIFHIAQLVQRHPGLRLTIHNTSRWEEEYWQNWERLAKAVCTKRGTTPLTHSNPNGGDIIGN